MTWTRQQVVNALHALHDATGADLAALAVVARVDPAAVFTVLELFTLAAVAIHEGEPDDQVRDRIRDLLVCLDAIRMRAASQRRAA